MENDRMYFDDMHFFSFEFIDNDFKKLQYFSVDG